jgi:hypothetical protein
MPSGLASGSFSGKGTSTKGPAHGSGSAVGYDRGPTHRIEPPRSGPAVTPPATKPTLGKGKDPRSSKQPTGSAADPARSWRELHRSDPTKSREILTTSYVASRTHDAAVGVALGTIGGVHAGGFRGGFNNGTSGSWACDPWGWNHPCWSSGCCFSGSFCWWSWPFYWSWYYPCWWWYSQPYYFTDYCYQYPATTVVYAQPQVVYADQQNVGEGVVAAQENGRVSAPAPAQSSNSLSITAQRYLDLGDRAFREGRYTDSVQFYAKAVEFAPDQGALYLVLSDALFAAGDYHYGAYAVRRAFELDPALIETSVDKHAFYPDPALFDQQLAVLERYLAQHPDDRDARLVLGLNYLFGGRAKDAAHTIEAAGAAMADDLAAQKVLQRANTVGK